LMVLLLLCLVTLTLSGCAKPKGGMESQIRTTEPPAIESPAESGVTEVQPNNEVQEKQPVAIVTKKPVVAQKADVKPPEIGMDELVERLKKTEAIGVFTKLAIRSDVLDFKTSIDTYRKKGELERYLGHLRDHFDGLLLKILALLERDPSLSKDIQHARESIWRSFLEAKS